MLKDTGPGIDFVVIRENPEGLFASFGGGAKVGREVATDTMVITRAGTSRVSDFAFRLAQRRNGRPSDGRKMVTCVDKANVFRSMAFFREVFMDVAKSYPDIENNAVYVDAMSLYMVQNPWDFDVLVMENQFGDILSDLGAGLVGGLGLGPSAEIGEEHGLFQPSHGTAPQLAGKNVANPMATIFSAALMLDWLGDRYDDSVCTDAAVRLENAVERVLRDGRVRTPDIGGTASTTDVAHAIADAIDTPPSPRSIMNRFVFPTVLLLATCCPPAWAQQPMVDESLVFSEADGLVAVEAEHFYRQGATDPCVLLDPPRRNTGYPA